MRVLHIISGLGVGGAELFLRRLAGALRDEHGVEQHVVSLLPSHPDDVDFSTVPIPISHLNLRGPRSTLRGIAQQRAILRSFKPDLIQAWMYNANIVGTLARLRTSTAPLLWNIRCTAPELSFQARMSVLVCQVLARVGPDRVVCCGRRACRVHIAQGYDAKRMTVINNGFIFDEPLPATVIAHEPNSLLTIGAAGRADPAKDYRTLLVAARDLTLRGHRFRLRIAGRGCDENNSWFTGLLNELGLEGQVDLLGQQSDMTRFYDGLDIFCLSSNSEGFPNVLCEAMARAVPAVATDVGDAAEIVGDHGFIVPPCDPRRLADALERMITMSPQKRAVLGRSGALRVRKDYGLRSIAAEYMDLYRTVIAQSGQAS